MRREPASGALVLLPQGCSLHCSYADGLNNPVSLAVTPDGRDVIVGNRRAGLSVYRRGQEGRLRMVSCLGWRWPGIRCAPGDTAFYPSIAVAPGGRDVYVGSADGQRKLTVLARDAASGRLRKVEGRAGCFLWAIAPNESCGYVVVRGFRPEAVTVSPDGRNVYVSLEHTFGAGAVYAFARNRSTGTLTLLPQPSGCFGAPPADGCTAVPGLRGGPFRVPRDGRHAYYGGRVFARNAATGGLTLLAARVPLNLELSPDGATAYSPGARLGVYRRRFDGLLSPLAAPHGAPSGGAVHEIVVTPDGRHLYARREGWTTVYRVAR